MLGGIFNFLFFYVRKIRFSYSWGNLIKRGLVIGHNFSYEKGLIIDKIYPSFITIGNNVTFSANCSVLAHDAGLANIMGLVRVGKVRIGNNVFIGLGSTILPGVEIGDNVIIGAGSIVSKSIPANNVAAGCPCRIVCSLEDYRKKIIEMTNVGGYLLLLILWIKML